MESTIQLIDLLGAAALLFWGLRLIKTGVMRAFGAVLRQWISRGTRNRASAAAWGFLATLGLQSSTATAVITGSFVSREIISPRMAQAVMLGANLGTAIVTVLLSRDLHWLGSAFILVGVASFTLSAGSQGKAVGRALLGLGLILLALRLLGGVTEPLRESRTVVAMLSGLADAPVFALVFSAGLALLGSSSLAVVLLVMFLAGAGVVPPPLALVLVAGANLGGAIPPYLAVAGDGLAARRLTLANLMVRGVGALAVLVAAAPLTELLLKVTPDPADLTVAAHVGFNAALLLLFLPLIGPVGGLAERFLPSGGAAAGSGPEYLDDSLLDTPGLALAVAARETLRVGDIVGAMLEKSRLSLENSDEATGLEVTRLEQEVDALTEAIKLYVSRLSRLELDAADVRRANEIISYAINLEHMGDIIETGLTEIAVKKIRKRLMLSPEGLVEIAEFYDRTADNLRLAQAIFLGRDADLARQLMQSKIEIRKLEANSAAQHLARVRAGRSEAIETSTIHLDLLRDLKRVNAHLTSVAHPILHEIGVLQESRVRASQSEPKPALGLRDSGN